MIERGIGERALSSSSQRVGPVVGWLRIAQSVGPQDHAACNFISYRHFLVATPSQLGVTDPQKGVVTGPNRDDHAHMSRNASKTRAPLCTRSRLLSDLPQTQPDPRKTLCIALA